MFQSDNLLPFLTAAENVGLQLALRSGAAETARAPLICSPGWGSRRISTSCPTSSPVGSVNASRSRAALVHEPGVILADEPTGSLDAENAAGILELLLEFQQERAATLVMVTHDLGVAARLDRTISMRDGRLA